MPRRTAEPQSPARGDYRYKQHPRDPITPEQAEQRYDLPALRTMDTRAALAPALPLVHFFDDATQQPLAYTTAGFTPVEHATAFRGAFAVPLAQGQFVGTPTDLWQVQQLWQTPASSRRGVPILRVFLRKVTS